MAKSKILKLSFHVQALIEANDGLVDGPGAYTEEAQLMGSCIHLLLQSVLAILSW